MESLLSPNEQRLLREGRLTSWSNSWLQTGVLVTFVMKLLGLLALWYVLSHSASPAIGLVVPAAVLGLYVIGWRRRDSLLFAGAASGLAAFDTIAFVVGPRWEIIAVMGAVQYAVAIRAWRAWHRGEDQHPQSGMTI